MPYFKKKIVSKSVQQLILFFLSMLIFASFTMPMLSAQIPNEVFKKRLQPVQKLKKGEVLSVTFESHRADKAVDTGRWKNKAIDENTIEIDFLVENTSNINPYKSAYKYLIQLLDGDAFQMEMTAAINP